LPHYYGQRVITQSSQLVNAAYDTPWYEKNSFQRKFLLTLMMNSQEEMKINVKGFYDLDLDNLGLVN
jgi:hypothetical protein